MVDAGAFILFNIDVLSPTFPKDFSIIGFDNSVIANNLKPALSSINLPISEMTKKAIQHIFDNKQYDLAEKTALILSKKFPNHPFSWKVLGAVFDPRARLSLLGQ